MAEFKVKKPALSKRLNQFDEHRLPPPSSDPPPISEGEVDPPARELPSRSLLEDISEAPLSSQEQGVPQSQDEPDHDTHPAPQSDDTIQAADSPAPEQY